MSLRTLAENAQKISLILRVNYLMRKVDLFIQLLNNSDHFSKRYLLFFEEKESIELLIIKILLKLQYCHVREILIENQNFIFNLKKE